LVVPSMRHRRCSAAGKQRTTTLGTEIWSRARHFGIHTSPAKYHPQEVSSWNKI
jgi:hypothetical protein